MSELLCDSRQDLITQAHTWIAELQQRRDNEYHGERLRPFFMLRPKLFIDGNQWCALHGENLQKGLAGFGKSPSEASYAFDASFNKTLPDTPSHNANGNSNLVKE